MSAHQPPVERATLANWRSHPFSTWAFQNIRSLMPTDNIGRGTGVPSALRTEPRELGGIEFEDAKGRLATVDQALVESDTNGFLVLHRGAIVAELYANGLRPETPHLLMSISKSVTSSLTAILIERNLVQESTVVTDVLPELDGSAYARATIRHLLDMTVGTTFSENNDGPEGDATRFDTALGWLPVTTDSADGAHRFFAAMQPRGPHGQTFHYASPNTDVLGWILERVSGLSLAELLSREIWQPIGAEFDAYITVDRHGAAVADGGICATLRDLGRFGQLCLERGELRGQRILPDAWFSDIIEKGQREVWQRSRIVDAVPGIRRYRNNWWVTDNDHRAYCGVGVHGQSLYIDPTAAMVIAKLSSQPLAVDLAAMDVGFRVFHALGKELASR